MFILVFYSIVSGKCERKMKKKKKIILTLRHAITSQMNEFQYAPYR